MQQSRWDGRCTRPAWPAPLHPPPPNPIHTPTKPGPAICCTFLAAGWSRHAHSVALQGLRRHAEKSMRRPPTRVAHHERVLDRLAEVVDIPGVHQDGAGACRARGTRGFGWLGGWVGGSGGARGAAGQRPRPAGGCNALNLSGASHAASPLPSGGPTLTQRLRGARKLREDEHPGVVALARNVLVRHCRGRVEGWVEGQQHGGRCSKKRRESTGRRQRGSTHRGSFRPAAT